MKTKALLALIIVGALVVSCGGQPPPEPQPPQPQPQPQPEVQPTPGPAPGPATAAGPQAVEASPDSDPKTLGHNCNLCEMLQNDCAAAGRGDCGSLQADCQQKCQAVKAAAGSAKRGTSCSADAQCGSGLCCRMGKCGLNQLFYYPVSGSSPGGDPGQVGVVLQCP
jgi:hypothetical protein